MFVKQSRLGSIRNKFFTIRDYPRVTEPKGCIPFLERDCNPKGNLAYKYIFEMQSENQFVADSQLAKTTPLHVVDHHAQNFYNTIKNFYSFANPSDFIEANNDLLNTYLEKGLDEEEGFTKKHLQNIVFMVNLQNQFLTALKENFEALKNSNDH